MKNDSFTFLGRLLELPTSAPRCGDVKVAVGHRFEVQTVLEGKAIKGPISLIVPCPDLKGDGFIEAGATYRVKAARLLSDSSSYTVYNDYAGSSLFWAADIARA